MKLSRRSLLLLLPGAGCAAMLGFANLAFARPPQGSLIVTPFRKSANYKRGETVGWRIGTLGSTSKLTYTVKLNNTASLASGEIDLSRGPADVTVKVSEPGMVLMQVTTPEGQKKYYGAAVDPQLIKPVDPRPKDFDRFWAQKVAALKKIPANPKLTLIPNKKEGIDFGVLKMDHVNGTHVWGHYAAPSKPGKYPAMLIVQWASPPYPLSPDWAIGPAQQGWIVLNIEPHDVPPNESPEFYQKVPPQIKAYNTLGMESRETSYFVEMYLRGYRAVDYLASLPNWDGKTILVTGGSMGGQQSLAIAGLHPKVTHMMAEEPAGCEINASAYKRQMGYPFLSPENPKVRATNPYIDGVNFASRIKATSLVGMGYIDTVCPPTGVWAAFNQIKGKKTPAMMTEAAHNNEATWEQQKPYYDIYNQWISAIPKGQTILLPR